MQNFPEIDPERLRAAENVSSSTHELSDEALIHAIAGGAVWAMEPLYLRYSRIMYSMAYRMVDDHQIAEDLLTRCFSGGLAARRLVLATIGRSS